MFLLTVDRGFPHELPAGLRIAVILIETPTNQLEDLLPIVQKIIEALRSVKPGQLVRVASGA